MVKVLWYLILLIILYSVIHWGYDRKLFPGQLQSGAGVLIETVEGGAAAIREHAVSAGRNILSWLDQHGVPIPEGLAWKEEQTAESTSGLAAVSLPADMSGYLLVDCIDVGQGDATFIRQGDHTMLFDCGGETGMVLRAYMKKQQISHLDSVWLSHPDKDHIESFPAVSYAARIDMVYSNGETRNTAAWGRVEETLRYDRLPLKIPEAGFRCSLGDAEIEVLGPLKRSAEPDGEPDEQEDPETGVETDTFNDHSLVIRISYGGTSFLLCGDAQSEEEKQLLQAWGDELRSDVLHVAHHGSSTSSSTGFLETVAPAHAVISCGKDNDFGHPHRSVLKRLERTGAAIWRTDEMGSVRFLSDGDSLQVGSIAE